MFKLLLILSGLHGPTGDSVERTLTHKEPFYTLEACETYAASQENMDHIDRIVNNIPRTFAIEAINKCVQTGDIT